jgi:hypothetical protein
MLQKTPHRYTMGETVSNWLTTLADTGKDAVQYVLNQANARPVYNPLAATPYYGTPPIVANSDEVAPWRAGIDKITDDLLAQLKGIARDTARAVAGGTMQAIQDTPEYRAEKAKAGLALLGVGVIAIAALVYATRKAG